MQSEQRSRWAILIIVLSFILLGFAYSAINPLFEATDELRHYRFVQHIIQQKSLPVQGSVGCSAQGHHPPLFYSAAALATWWIDTGEEVCFEPLKNPFWAYRYWEIGRDNKNQYLHGQAHNRDLFLSPGGNIPWPASYRLRAVGSRSRDP